ncbi:ABC transporter permease [Pseudoclavibacter sp. 13-3]|uniref:ABC transporter permease n=1 Tax=Pseudoclavibacter sp. 13-3 TaxID=2901228 RepID=UPI001E43DB33|nr:ABC transporter permease [Pseudoclavibacter sp. 13-3]MCD7101428.1 ABC transporter permease [Pseudoclavibacter sp. 13-3]
MSSGQATLPLQRAIFSTPRPKVPISVLVAAVLIVIVVLWSAVPAWFTSYDIVSGSAAEKFLPPSGQHWFGTDHLGRDMFARVVYGSASSVTSALIAVFIGLIVGGLIGLVGGFLGGWVDSTLGRIVDVLLAIPSFLLAVIVVSALGFYTVNAAIATGVSAVAVFARVMRSEVIKVRSSVFVEAAGLQGGLPLYVLFRHVLPNTYRSVLALAILQFGSSILVIAGLAFLGYGDPPPASDWGLLVAGGKDYPSAPWLVLFPSAAIAVTVLSVNVISRWLRQKN